MSGLEGLLAGRILVKRYRIEEVIGRGGFAAVYRAADERLGRSVAVKVITLPAPDDAVREQLRERLQREARAVASLPQHPNVVTVHDFGTDPETQLDFLVMEFLQGQDLATFIDRKGRPPLELAVRILRDATEGLAVGHRAGLIHRDVKPGNIFLAEAHGEDPFRVCVLDFGIARVAATEGDLTRLTQGAVPLSPSYASPEQMRGERDFDARSDVFSLGVVGYLLLTGVKPFAPERKDTPEDWVLAQRVREIDPEVPAELEAVIERAMSFDPAARYSDAAAMAAVLDEVTVDDQTIAAPIIAGAAGAAVGGSDAPATVAESVPNAHELDHTILQTPPAPAAPGDGAAARPDPPPPARRSFPVGAMILVLLVLAVGGGLWALNEGGGDGPQEGEVIGRTPADDEEAGLTGTDPIQDPGGGSDAGAAGSEGRGSVAAQGTGNPGASAPRTGGGVPGTTGSAPPAPGSAPQPRPGEPSTRTGAQPAQRFPAQPSPAQPSPAEPSAAQPSVSPPDTAQTEPAETPPPPRVIGTPARRDTTSVESP